MKKIFISYTRDDESIVEDIIENLEIIHSIWYDRKLGGGQKWWAKILNELIQADVVLFVMSDKSLDSVACRKEYSYASELGKPIIPVLVDDNLSLNSLPKLLAETQLVNYLNKENKPILQLLKAISSQEFNGLPDPLPIAPTIPLSYLSKLKEQINFDGKLT